jgi:uncharacterized protein YbaR (Trm112 family)
MHLELVDVLRCPQPHEPSPLIASIDRVTGRSIDRGALGCPICDRRYPIDRGSVVFDADARDRSQPAEPAPPPSPESVLRAAALLGLLDPGGVIVLGGVEARLAAPLRDMVDVSMILYNPPGSAGGWERVTPMYGRTLSLAPSTLRAAWLDDATATAVDGAVDALQIGGRLVAPAATPLPAGVRELARDAESWVAERIADAVSAPVALRRGARA